ncbi:hypothetical protein KIP37_21905 [Xanthomonas campestris pv. campestris]|nr:hypothetical protein [Xanthomonas campestris pv. campestris]
MGMIRRLMTASGEDAGSTAAPEPIADLSPESMTAEVRLQDVEATTDAAPAPQLTLEAERGEAVMPPAPTPVYAPTGAQLTLSMLRAMGPIFRAALVYPGPTAPAVEWAQAIKVMSDVSAQVAGQLALMRTEELDVAWARRELHPAVAVIVGEHWLHTVIKMQRVQKVGDIKLSAEDILPGIVAALKAADDCGNPHLATERSAVAELLPAIALLQVNAQAYQALLQSDTVDLDVPDLSVDGYLQAVAAAVVDAVQTQDARAKLSGALHGDEFREALLRSATGIVVKAGETAVNESLARLHEAIKASAPGRWLSEEPLQHGFPLARTVELIEQGMNRLAGTAVYIASKLGSKR